MDNTAQTPTIPGHGRALQRRRTLPEARQRPPVAHANPPDGHRRAWLAHVDEFATPNERGLLFWLDWAARYHTDPVRDIIVALKTVEHLPSGDRAAPSLYVWEVAWYRRCDGIKWQFIVWDVSGYGVRFLDCASKAEAMALYALPVEEGIAAVRSAPGVYWRAECPPV